MSAFLMPCSGGDAIPINRSRVYLGRTKTADRTAPVDRDTGLCQLELIDGWWHIEDLRSPNGVRVNGRTIKREKLAPDDEIEFARHRYRISFEAPKYRFGRKPGGQFGVAAPKPAAKPAPHAVRRQDPGLLGRLVPLEGGEDVPLRKVKLTIGRRPDRDIVLKHSTISGKHCELELLDGYWRVKDAGSRNGIRIDGRPCPEGWIKPASRLTIGTQRFSIDYLPQGPPPIDDLHESLDGRSLLSKAGLADDRLEDVLARHTSPEDEQPEQKKWNLMEDL